MRDMLIAEAGHEEVRVVVPVLVPHRQPLEAGLLDGRLEVLGQQLLLLVEVVARADVDEDVEGPALPPLDQLRGVVLGPLGLAAVAGAQVAGKGLLAPGAVDRVGDGREGGGAPVLARVLEVEGQGAVAAHGVAGDGDAAGVEEGAVLGGAEEGVGQLLGQVRLHAVVLAEGRLGGVDVEGGGLAKVPGVALAGEVEAPRGGVRVEDGDVVERGGVLEEALLGAVVRGAGQAREPDEDGDLLVLLGGLGGQVEVQVHGGAGGGGLVGQLEEGAAEGGDCGSGFEGHFG